VEANKEKGGGQKGKELYCHNIGRIVGKLHSEVNKKKESRQPAFTGSGSRGKSEDLPSIKAFPGV